MIQISIMSEPSCQVDLNAAAKSTKLFKKFLENKSKAAGNPPAKLEAVNLSLQPTIPNTHIQTSANNQDLANSPNSFNCQVEQQYTTFGNLRKTEKIQSLHSEGRTYGLPTEGRTYDLQAEGRTQAGKDQEDNKCIVFGKLGENQFGKQHQRVMEELEEMKETVKSERRKYKTEILKLEEQLDSYNKKNLEISNHEDDLIIENRRIRDRMANEVKLRQQVEEANREMGFQVQELKDRLDGQENENRKKSEDLQQLKKTNEELKQEIRCISVQCQKYQDLCEMYERERGLGDREQEAKEMHINELRQKISTLISENSYFKDEVFQLTAQVYRVQQENEVLKADLRRLEQPLHEHRQHDMSAQQRPITPIYRGKAQRDTLMEQGSTKTERGEFCRERASRRARKELLHNQRQPVQISNDKPNKDQARNSSNQQKRARLESLNQQVQKLRDSKAMSGAMRREKINLQREIQQIQQFIREHGA